MALSDGQMRRAGELVADMRATAESLFADDGDLAAEQIDDLWTKYFEAQTELEQLLPPGQ